MSSGSVHLRTIPSSSLLLSFVVLTFVRYAVAGEATEVDAEALNSENVYWLDYRKDRAFIGSELRNGRFKIDSFVHARFTLIYIHPLYMVVMLTEDLSAVYLANTNSCTRWQRGVISWPGVGGARQEEGEYEGNLSFICIFVCLLSSCLFSTCAAHEGYTNGRNTAALS